MGNENGVWIMRGLSGSDPRCVHTVEQLIFRIEKVGFLPLFKNEIDGFSVEECVESAWWWSGDEKRDPWEWRKIIAADGRVAYGKFFGKKAGFIAKKWLPCFANYRRDGYDFDSLWEDGKASARSKKIMDLFAGGAELFSNELKAKAGFGRNGEKNFEGVVTALQMQTYLCVRDFEQRVSAAGEPFGWPIAIYTTPERIFGADFVASEYNDEPSKSHEKILRQMQKLYPGATEKQLAKI